MTVDTSRPAVRALIADLRKDAERDAAHRNGHARATKFNRKTMPAWVAADVLASLLDERDAACEYVKVHSGLTATDRESELGQRIRDLEAAHERDMHTIGQHALAQASVLDKLRAAEAKLDAVKAWATRDLERAQPKYGEYAEGLLVAQEVVRAILADTDEGSEQ